jgi:hypothetical protein
MRGNHRWYRRRLPLIAELPSPARISPKVLPPLVARSDNWRRGVAFWFRPPLKPVVQIAGKLFSPLIVRPDVPGRMRTGIWRRLGWPILPAVPFTKTDRVFWLRAAAVVAFHPCAAVGTVFNLRASEAMSVPSNLSFFQGEDIQLNFAVTPPADITGWTLTGTVQNKLGGATQFTFTPSIQDAGRGWFQASFARAQTSNLSPGDYVWDIRRTDAGKNAVLAHGEITIKQPVTP